MDSFAKNRPTGEVHVPLAMSALLYTGGMLGYRKAKSVPSLVAGVSFGTGYAISAWLVSRGDGKEGHMLSLGLSSTLATVMGLRYYRTRSIFPPGILAGAAGGSAIYHAVKLNQWMD